mmetsp:Transcript_2616/g.3867  ORF Transcript_2616/g.3867 Transcript_2616/m.3867 type:complete len:84 (-) Transcript_2616:682-933(-)
MHHLFVILVQETAVSFVKNLDAATTIFSFLEKVILKIVLFRLRNKIIETKPSKQNHLFCKTTKNNQRTGSAHYIVSSPFSMKP